MNPIAKELNDVIKEKSPVFYDMLSELGKALYMPKGILEQSAEAKQKANKYNATIGIAKENNEPMYLPSVKKYFNNLSADDIFPYAPPIGDPDLRKLWKNKMIEDNPSLKSADRIGDPIVTSGLTNGIMVAADMFADEDDEIVIPDKLWGNYRMIYEVRKKAKIITFDTFDKALTSFNVAGLDEAIEKTTKDKVQVLLNFPNNPTGYTPTIKEAEEIVDVVLKHAKQGKKILVISDDSYFGLLFEEKYMEESIFSKFVGLHENICAIKLDGFTKEFYVWGLRVGFMTFADFKGDKDVYISIEKKVAGCLRGMLSNCSKPGQSILTKILKNGDYKQERAEKYEVMKGRALKLKEIVYDQQYEDCWDVYPFNSGYFMCIKVKGVDANQLRVYLLDKYSVGTISLGATDLRIAFSCIPEESLAEVFELIAKSIREMKG